MPETVVRGRLVLEDRVVPGEITIVDAVIERIETADPAAEAGDAAGAGSGVLIAPGFIDVHVHGWGGFSSTDGREALDGMARSLLARGVSSFLPTAATAPLPALEAFAESVRDWRAAAPDDGAEPLGFNLEGPFLSEAKKGAHDADHLRRPADVRPDELDAILDGLRLITIAPELPGALQLIAVLTGRGIRVSLGHSAAALAEAQAGYAAGATSTTHLFNAMSGVDHRRPGLAAAALADDAVWVELIADGHHVDAALLPIITRAKPADRLLLVSDALSAAGTAQRQTVIGGLECEIDGTRVTLAGTTTLAGSVIALDDAVRSVVAAGLALPAAVAAASANPAAMLGATDRGRIAAGLRADLVELDEALRVRRVMRGGTWFEVD
jgi:N-acetylglucosamine-6-phosphate deacetylase